MGKEYLSAGYYGRDKGPQYGGPNVGYNSMFWGFRALLWRSKDWKWGKPGGNSVAVKMPVARHSQHRSGREEQPHPAPALGDDT